MFEVDSFLTHTYIVFQEKTINRQGAMKKENFKFSTETDKIFKLMVHSLYENKDIFIRELISNASDACDKLRFEAIQKPELISGEQDIKISVEVDKTNRNLIIRDNGIGMNKQSLIENLGTIARSGTQRFMEQLTGDAKKDSSLIGQFGVGFYSCFMVSDNVTVISQAAGEDKAYIWNSNGNGEYSISDAEFAIGRGTQITIHIKEGEDEYLDKFRVKNIIDTYSSHIPYKIYFKEDNGNEVLMNEGQAIWLKNKSEIKPEEYEEFYQSISFMGDDKPLFTLHTKAEGTLEYSSLLFVPSKKPFDLYHPDRQTRVKLYIKRVLISEKISIIPQYLRFLRGVVDSADLPLNISRETIQNNANVQKIRTAITKKTLKEFTTKLEKQREDYLKFWKEFGAVVKEGLCDGLEPRDEILEACLFETSSSDALVSLKEYKTKMKSDQKAIYYITAEDRKSALASPQIEGFLKQGFEVILLTDSVDDFWVNVLHEYQGTPFKSVTKAGSDIEDTAEKDEDKKDEKQNKNEGLDKLCNYIKSLLGEKVLEVKKTSRLAESPVCLTVPEGGMEIRFERFMIENKQLNEARPKIFELNQNHKIILKLSEQVNDENLEKDELGKKKIDETIKLLFAQANIVEGEPVPDIKEYTSNINRLIELSLVA